MKSVVMCLFCGILLRYKSIILSVDERIMALKIRVADLRWRCFVDFSCGDAVFVNFFCGVAVFRTPPCPPPPHLNLPVRDGINCGAHNRYGFPSCRDQLVSNVLQAAKAGPAKPVSKRRNNYSGDGYWFPGPNANLPDLRVAVFCLPPTRFFCDNELASLRCCDVSFCDAFVRIYLLRSKTDSL